MIKLVSILNEIRPRGAATFIIKPTKWGGDISSPELNIKMYYFVNEHSAVIDVASDYDLMRTLGRRFGDGPYDDDEEDYYYPVDESAYFCDNNLHHFKNFFGEAKVQLDGYNCSQIVIPIELFNKKIKK